MRRVSYYVRAEAADAMEQAVETVMYSLDTDVPKHVIISALLTAAAAQASQVTADLARERAADLAQRLRALQEEAGGPTT